MKNTDEILEEYINNLTNQYINAIEIVYNKCPIQVLYPIEDVVIFVPYEIFTIINNFRCYKLQAGYERAIVICNKNKYFKIEIK